MNFRYIIKKHYTIILLIALALALSALTMLRYPTTGLAFLIATGLLAILTVIKTRRGFHKTMSDIAAVNASLDPSGRDLLDSFPLPVLVSDENGVIVWYNSRFSDEVMGKDIVIEDTTIDQFTSGIGIETIKKNTRLNVEYNGKKYTLFQNPVERRDGDLYVLYFDEDTELKNIKIEYDLAHPAVMLISVDSIDDLYNSYSDSELAEITSGVEKLIEAWFKQFSGFLRRIGNGRFIAVIEERNMKKIIEGRFDILEQVRNYSYNDRIVGVTLSIGVGRTGNIEECENDARQAIDMALGRGGDQAVIRTDTGFDFFGGVSNGLEKRTKVRTRVVSKAIVELVNNYKKVYIMGHRFSDLDAIGAAIGLHKILTSLGVDTKIVVNKKTSLASSLIEMASRKGYEDAFIEPSKAENDIDERSVLFVVDTHRPDYVESPELYKKAKNVVVIDHHRKTVDYIQNAVIFYHEPHASSACEMVAELAQYISKKPVIGQFEANAMLSGITLDTKNFVLRTGVRTFEAAAYLRGRGADTVEVKQFFSSSIETNKQKNEIVSRATTYKSSAISYVEDNSIKELRIVASQAADEMLYISDINASYVLFRQDGRINISARSMGKVNVQLVMEKLGGGGHQTMAACQLECDDYEQAVALLKEAIDYYDNNSNGGNN
ncbi:MAG: DHH family phosphoesterase [Clostridia bacterium]|nr:DHH family phosphoesterase [Clostridia bacterium]